MASSLRKILSSLSLFGIGVGYTLAFSGAFEQALDTGNPIWSSVFGFPFFHHYIYGFIILGISIIGYMVIQNVKKIKKIFSRPH